MLLSGCISGGVAHDLFLTLLFKSLVIYYSSTFVWASAVNWRFIREGILAMQFALRKGKKNTYKYYQVA